MERWFITWSEREYAVSARSLACFRIFFSVALLLTLVPKGYGIDRLPAEAFEPPPGLPRVFQGLPGPAWYWVMNGALVLLLTALLVGWRTRRVSLAVAVVIVLLYARRYSTGKIGHSFLLALTPLLLSMSNWGEAMSVDAWQRGRASLATRRDEAVSSARALALLAMGVGLSMASAGVLKVGSGWLSPADSSTFGHTLNNFVRGRDALLTPMIFRVMPGWAWEVMDWMAVGLELGFGLAWLNRRVFRLFLVAAIFFHIGVALMFNIYFFRNLIVYAAFLDWVAVLSFLGQRHRLRVSKPRWGWVVAGASLSLMVGVTAVGLTDSIDHFSREGLGIVCLALPGTAVSAVWLGRMVSRAAPRSRVRLRSG